MTDSGSGRPAFDYVFGPFRFDSRLGRLFKEGQPVGLTPKAGETLAALLDRAGRIVDKDELLRVVWPDVFVGEDTLAQNVSTLRRVLGDDPNRPQFIATVPRRGYKFVAIVRPVPSGRDVDDADSETPRPSAPPSRPDSTASRTGRLGAGAGAVAAAAVAVVAGGFAIGWFEADDPPRLPVEFTVAEPPGAKFSASGGTLALSPDGAYLSFVVIDNEGDSSLWVRPLASAVARPMAGTGGAANPFWSPDSRTIAFFAERRLKTVDVASGAVRVVASLPSGRSLGGSWSSLGHILVSIPDHGLFVVPSTGGSPAPLESVDRGCEVCGTWPHFLPDGRHFLYTVARAGSSPGGIYVGEIGQNRAHEVVDALSSATFIAPGLLSFARAGTLYVQPFDTASLRVHGTPVPVVDNVAQNARTGRVLATTSNAGVLAFRKTFITELVWVDRAGRAGDVAAPAGIYLDFSIAPDGQRVAAARVDPRTGTSDIWVIDGGRELRVTDDAGWDRSPVWSTDGEHVAYSARRDGRWRIYRRQATAVGPEELMLDSDTPLEPLQMLSSAHVLYSARRPSQPFDLWKLGHDGAQPVAELGGFYPGDARLSPDEQWLAYGRPETSGNIGRQTVYVSGRPFGGTRRAIAEAASMPRWRADGRELFYLSGDSAVMAVPVDPRRTPSDAAGGRLFLASGVPPTGIIGQVYDVTADGRRFLLKREVAPSPVHVLLNWDAAGTQ
jgi:DNA-binding winged helix-turn-helix (wHTH) protein/Tol biopolymer transport system component